jgi:hypothetical protein
MDSSLEEELRVLTARFADELSRAVTGAILRRLGIDASRVLEPSASSPASRGVGSSQGASTSSGLPARGPGRKSRGARAQGEPPAATRASAPKKRAGKALEAEGARSGSRGAPSRARGEPPHEPRERVLRVVRDAPGLGLGEIARRAGLDPRAASRALVALKLEGRVHMGGARRFARYALTQADAERAASAARAPTDAEPDELPPIDPRQSALPWE